LQNKLWFESWFDSPYYHLLYRDRDACEAEKFITNLINRLTIGPKSKILDVACGKGRHSVYLAAQGFEVTGIDLSQQSIAFARTFESDHLSFYRHDMRDIFRVNYFDLGLNLFTSLGYFDNQTDNAKAIKATALNLKIGGKLVIDFFNAQKVQQNLIPEQTKTVEHINFYISKRIEDNNILKTIQFSDKGNSYTFQEKVTLLTLTQFQHFLDDAGLKLLEVFGNYQFEQFNEKTSERLILIAKKVT
jgi:SAM-dependent methyltransferase